MDINEDFFVRFNDYEEFDEWCWEGDWEGAPGFKKSTGVDYHDIENQFFQVVHGRVYIAETQNHVQEDIKTIKEALENK